MLRYEVNSIHTTLLRVEIQADDLRYVTNIANGTIDMARVLNEGFTALSEFGTLEVLVTNTDMLVGTFLVQVNCSKTIQSNPLSQ